MTDITVRPISTDESAEWDIFVRRCGMGTLFHTSIWRNVIDAGYGQASYTLLAAFSGTKIVGGFAALERSRLGVKTVVTPLCTPFSGFLLDIRDVAHAEIEQQVVLTLLRHLRRYRLQNLQCVPAISNADILERNGYKIIERATSELDLQQPEEKLWTGFDSQARRNIRKAQKVGFTISSRWDGQRAYEIMKETFRRHGEGCPVPERLFGEIADGLLLDRHRRRYCAWNGDTMEGFLVALRYDGRVYYELAATSSAVLSSGISSLLIWEMLKDHLDGQWEVFDFNGANTPSIAKFKQGFGPSRKQYFEARYCTSRRIRFALWARGLIRCRQN